MNHGDYATVAQVRREYLASDRDARDPLIHSLITSTSREIDAAAERKFYPTIETRQYDTPRGRRLVFDEDLLSATTITNGDGEEITDYRLYPLNETPKHYAELSGVAPAWSGGALGDSPIEVEGVWGCHRDYASAWQPVMALGAQLTTAATTLTAPSGVLSAGHLLKINSEMIYVSDVAVSTATDTVTLARAANGSSAAQHTTGAQVYAWDNPLVSALCCRAVAAYYRLRVNPVGETVTVDGQTFQTPKEIAQWIERQAQTMGLVRIQFG